jgi:hypothetical protein
MDFFDYSLLKHLFLISMDSTLKESSCLKGYLLDCDSKSSYQITSLELSNFNLHFLSKNQNIFNDQTQSHEQSQLP